MADFLHISDLHNKPGCEAKLAYIREHYPEHRLIATGDLTQDGSLKQYEWLVGQNYKWIASPGNHDLEYAGIFNWGWREKLKRFDDTCGTGYAASQYVEVRTVANIAIIGLNSNPGFFNFAKGWVGPRQRRALADALEKYKSYIRIVHLHHHPFMSHMLMKLADSDKLMKILAGNCHGLFFGHKHLRKRFYAEQKRYNIQVIHCAGALYREQQALQIRITDKIEAKLVKII